MSEKSATRQSSSRQQQQHQSHHSSIRHSSPPSKNVSPGLGPSIDEEDSEQKRIRWETPTTHRYQLAEQPRLLEEKFLNVLDSMPTMVCSHQGFDKPLMAGGNMMWNLLEGGNQRRGQGESGGGSSMKKSGAVDDNSNSQSHFSDDSVDSVFEDGPSVVHISSNLPVFSESITASESLLSGSDSDEEFDGSEYVHRRHHSKHESNPPADTSQILDDLSGMESERSREQRDVEYDNAPMRVNNSNYISGDGRAGQEKIVVANHNNRPPVKIYSTSMPFEAEKEKKCLVSVGKLHEMHKARSAASTARNQRDDPNKINPPIPDISVGASNEISTMSASEDSYMYQSKIKQYRNYKKERTMGLPVGSIPENKGLRIESNAKILFDSSFRDETRSCIPTRLQRKRRGVDGATASSSSKSLGLRFMSKSGDANTTSEKENDEDSPYIYEYDTGMNTYVAYFETSTGKETRQALQVIEHPNPPMLPFGSNEVVVKIEVRAIQTRLGNFRRALSIG